MYICLVDWGVEVPWLRSCVQLWVRSLYQHLLPSQVASYSVLLSVMWRTKAIVPKNCIFTFEVTTFPAPKRILTKSSRWQVATLETLKKIIVSTTVANIVTVG